MKKRIVFLSSAVIAVGIGIAGFFISPSVFAQSMESGSNVSVDKNRTVNGTYFAAGEVVTIAGRVDGDVYCAGQTITISGVVTGDVICAGSTINLNGTVEGDIRVAGMNIVVGGDVQRNATIAGQSVTTEKGSTIDGDATLFAANSTLNGSIGRDVVAYSETLNVEGLIGRDLTAGVAQMLVGSAAEIKGNVGYTSAKDLTRAEGAVIDGTVSRTDPPKNETGAMSQEDGLRAFAAFAFYFLISMLIIALVAAFVMPRWLNEVTERLMPGPWKALLVGLAASVIVPIVTIGLMLTVVGIPLAFVLSVAWLLVILLSGIFSAFYVGRLLLKGHTTFPTMAVGGITLLLLYLIPVVNVIVALLAFWIGTGALLLEVAARRPYHYDSGATIAPHAESAAKKKIGKTNK